MRSTRIYQCRVPGCLRLTMEDGVPCVEHLRAQVEPNALWDEQVARLKLAIRRAREEREARGVLSWSGKDKYE